MAVSLNSLMRSIEHPPRRKPAKGQQQDLNLKRNQKDFLSDAAGNLRASLFKPTQRKLPVTTTQQSEDMARAATGISRMIESLGETGRKGTVHTEGTEAQEANPMDNDIIEHTNNMAAVEAALGYGPIDSDFIVAIACAVAFHTGRGHQIIEDHVNNAVAIGKLIRGA